MDATKAQAAKAELMKAVEAAGGWRTLTLGSKVYLHTASNAAQVHADLVKQAIRTGEDIRYPDGTREFYEWVAIYRFDEGGYIWKKGGGDICKHELVKTVVDKDNVATKTTVKTAWRKLDLSE